MKRKIIYTIVMLLLGLSGFLALFYGRFFREHLSRYDGIAETEDTAPVEASQKSGFYQQDISVELSTPEAPGSAIYYTTDCSTPSETSKTAIRYHKPISLEAEPTEKVVTIKCIAYLHHKASDVCTYTYVCGQSVASRYDTYVVSISGDQDALFGYENGVFTAGKLRQDYLDANPDISANDITADAPANYNVRGAASERAVTLQLFSSDGASLVTQNCGLRIFGNFTRAKAQKSFQLFARSTYDQNGTFHLTLSPDNTSPENGTILDRANRLVLRNSGDDYNHAFIRDSLLQQLARDAGFPCAYEDHPAAVYLNGKYYGFYWIREPFSDGYMRELYGDYDGEFIKLSVNDYTQTAEPEEDETSQAALKPYEEEYQKIYQTYCNANLQDDDTYEALNRIIDVDNYLQYYAIELYIGNKDWPYNNIKVYRYVNPDSKYRSGSVFDGRYRYLLNDTDYSFGLVSDSTAYSYDEDNISIVTGNDQSVLFANLMTREDCRAKLINDLCDLMNGAFSNEHVADTLQKLDSSRRHELTWFLKHSDLPQTGLTMADVDAETRQLYTFAQKRADCVRGFIRNDFPVNTSYDLKLSSGAACQVSVNSLDYTKNATPYQYFASSTLTLKANVDSGHLFSHWLINGKRFTGSTLTLSPATLLQLLGRRTDNTLLITPVTTDNPDATLTISMLHSSGRNDEVILYNASEHTISTEDLYLTDTDRHLKKYNIPTVNLAPGDVLALYGQKNELPFSVGNYRMNFNLSDGESLILSDSKKNILARVKIPALSSTGSWYVQNKYSGAYTEQLLTDKEIPKSGEQRTG